MFHDVYDRIQKWMYKLACSYILPTVMVFIWHLLVTYLLLLNLLCSKVFSDLLIYSASLLIYCFCCFLLLLLLFFFFPYFVSLLLLPGLSFTANQLL